MFFVKHVNFNLAKFARKGEQCFKHTNFEFLILHEKWKQIFNFAKFARKGEQCFKHTNF